MVIVGGFTFILLFFLAPFIISVFNTTFKIIYVLFMIFLAGKLFDILVYIFSRYWLLIIGLPIAVIAFLIYYGSKD